MLKQLEELKSNAIKELEAVSQAKELEAWRVHYLGKKSQLTSTLRGLAKLPIEERKQVGALANRIKTEFEEGLEQKARTNHVSGYIERRCTVVCGISSGSSVTVGRRKFRLFLRWI